MGLIGSLSQNPNPTRISSSKTKNPSRSFPLEILKSKPLILIPIPKPSLSISEIKPIAHSWRRNEGGANWEAPGSGPGLREQAFVLVGDLLRRQGGGADVGPCGHIHAGTGAVPRPSLPPRLPPSQCLSDRPPWPSLPLPCCQMPCKCFLPFRSQHRARIV